MDKNNLFNIESNYATALTFRTQFTGNHIPQIGNLFSTIEVRMQILIPIVNTENFYRLSVIDMFSIFSSEDNKLEIGHDSNDSVTLLLIKKPKNSKDDITANSNIKLPISSLPISRFILENSICELNNDLNKFLPTFLDYYSHENETLNKLNSKKPLLKFTENIKDKLSHLLN